MFKPLFKNWKNLHKKKKKTNIMRWAYMSSLWLKIVNFMQQFRHRTFHFHAMSQAHGEGGPWYMCRLEVCSVHIIAPGLGKSTKQLCPLFFNFLLVNLMPAPYDWQLNFFLSSIRDSGKPKLVFLRNVITVIWGKWLPWLNFWTGKKTTCQEDFLTQDFKDSGDVTVLLFSHGGFLDFE